MFPVLVPVEAAEPDVPPPPSLLALLALFAVLPVLVPVDWVEPETPPPVVVVDGALLAVLPVLVPVD